MIVFQGVTKSYKMGSETIHALRDVSLSIDGGEFIAVMGPSGSGKSTLMHLLGLLDVPDRGTYLVNGNEVGNLSDDDLASMRRDTFGFVFQQFNLLPRMTALENVMLPLIYSGRGTGGEREERASRLLSDVGLDDRADHKPNEMSGGQQQRVAIARSLANFPMMVLADEPTGNLDTASSREIMEHLKKLNDTGITIVIVTHEPEIAAYARRLITMRDGKILSDEKKRSGETGMPRSEGPYLGSVPDRGLRWKVNYFAEYVRQGFAMLAANKVRTGLSLLGILIGVAAVVAMLALGQGAQKAINDQLSFLGSNLLMLRHGAHRGSGGAMTAAGTITRLSYEDALAIKENVPHVREVSASVMGRVRAVFGNRNWNTMVVGVGPAYPELHAAKPAIGRFFTDEENRRRSRLAVVGSTIVKELFEGKNPIGEMIKINRVNFQVIGVLPEKGATGFMDQDDTILVPLMTGMYRLLGKDHVDFIDIEVVDPSRTKEVQEKVLELMYVRHRVAPAQREEAFQIRDLAEIQAALASSTKIMTLLLSSIAAISLVVGGIGIMNIMLVSVTERTKEIGLRKAVGARKRDILNQFLVESVAVSLIGGLLGIWLGWLATLALNYAAGWATSLSASSVALAFGFSASIGIIFGIYPARKASLLQPIDALRYE